MLVTWNIIKAASPEDTHLRDVERIGIVIYAFIFRLIIFVNMNFLENNYYSLCLRIFAIFRYLCHIKTLKFLLNNSHFNVGF